MCSSDLVCSSDLIDLDIYSRNISDFLIDRQVDVTEFGVDRRWENAGEVTSKGWELAVGYDVLNTGTTTYNTNISLSSNEVTLDEYPLELAQYGYLGSPGQNAVTMIRVKVGDPLGQIFAPVFDGVNSDGSPIFKDVNGDGKINSDAGNVLQDDYDGEVIGSAYPDLELGSRMQFDSTGALVIGLEIGRASCRERV